MVSSWEYGIVTLQLVTFWELSFQLYGHTTTGKNCKLNKSHYYIYYVQYTSSAVTVVCVCVHNNVYMYTVHTIIVEGHNNYILVYAHTCMHKTSMIFLQIIGDGHFWCQHL